MLSKMPPWMTSSAFLDEGLTRRRILHSNLDFAILRLRNCGVSGKNQDRMRRLVLLHNQ